MEEIEILNGDQFLINADCVIRSKFRTYYPVEHWNSRNLFFFEDISQNWNNPPLIFVNNDTDLNVLYSLLDKFKNPFVLLGHNSDLNITEDFAFIYEHPKIFHWFTQNKIVNHPKVSFLPIGKANPTWVHGNQQFFSMVNISNPSKLYKFYANFVIQTNPDKRLPCVQALQNFGIPIANRVDPLNFLYQLACSYYSICPQGNGIDTHRFFESIYFNTLPIVIRSPFTEMLAKEYPCCLIDSWDTLPSSIPPYNPSVFTDDVKFKLTFQFFQQKILQKVYELQNVHSL